ncbi:MAG: hypothetical protein R3E08_03230 [Thiotrichaceae bacterium]
MTDWKQLASHSHYQTAVAIQQALKQRDWVSSEIGIEEKFLNKFIYLRMNDDCRRYC